MVIATAPYERLEHTKRYLTKIEFLGVDQPLRAYCRKYEVVASGAAMEVKQKGHAFASAFKGQATVRLNMEFYVLEPAFHVLLMEGIRKGIPIIVEIGALQTDIKGIGGSFLADSQFVFTKILKDSATVVKAIGYIENANIVAEAGEFVLVNVTVLVDDYRQYDPEDLEPFD